MLDNGQDVHLVEVLPEESFDEYHLPGAVNIPGNELRDEIEDLVSDKDAKIVVYCGSPSCTASDRAAELLESMGYNNVFDYRGGKEHWKEGGLPIER